MTEKLYGPNHDQVALFIDNIPTMTIDEARKIQHKRQEILNDSAWSSARDSAWSSAKISARKAAWDSAKISAWACVSASAKASVRACVSASQALVVRDLISVEDFETLISPCRFLLEELGIVEPVKIMKGNHND